MMETYSGLNVDVLDLQPDQILIEDIAHALSLQCRFNGHVKSFYSVAQHSLFVSVYSNNASLFGLLHDAAEAYLGDLITPVKQKMPRYREYEKILLHKIFLKFCRRLPSIEESNLVALVDKRMLLTEAKHFLSTIYYKNWYSNLDPFSVELIPSTPEIAEQEFLREFHFLHKVID